MELVIVSGLSGAGKSSAADFLEDMGYFCVDNMPPQLFSRFADFCLQAGDRFEKVALVTDVRSRAGFKELSAALQELKDLSEATLRSVNMCLSIFENQSYDQIPEAEELEKRVDKIRHKIVNNHIQRLMEESCNPAGGVIFTDMATDLERSSDHAINVAYALSGDHQM